MERTAQHHHVLVLGREAHFLELGRLWSGSRQRVLARADRHLGRQGPAPWHHLGGLWTRPGVAASGSTTAKMVSPSPFEHPTSCCVIGSHYSADWRASALLVPATAPVGAPSPARLSARDRGDPRQEGHRTGRNLLKSVRQELLQACGNSMAVTVVAAALTQVLSHLCARAHAFGPLWSPPVLLLGARRT